MFILSRPNKGMDEKQHGDGKGMNNTFILLSIIHVFGNQGYSNSETTLASVTAETVKSWLTSYR